MGTIFGIDVGGTTIKMGMFDEKCQLKYKCEIKTDTSHNGKNILDDIYKEILKILGDNGLSLKDCAGVGIGLPGPVTSDGRILGCVNLGWGIFNVEEALSSLLGGILVKAGNDANIAALGEQSAGGGKNHKNMVMVTLGTGVGGGIILDGNMVVGSNGAAGEIGHIPVNNNETESCSCGKKGCLEQYASASGIVRLAKKHFGDNENISAKYVMDLAKEGNEKALIVTNELAKNMGMALASVASVINPECIVIGGGVSKAGQFLLDIIKESFEVQVFSPCKNVQFKLAELGNDAGIYGGAQLVKNCI